MHTTPLALRLLALPLLLVAACSSDGGSSESADTSGDTLSQDTSSGSGSADTGSADTGSGIGDTTADATEDTAPDTTPPGGPYEACFPAFVNEVGVDFDSLGLPVAGECQGTIQQDFENIERVVFLGDSITNGTGGGNGGAYRDLLAARLTERYPGVVIDDCSVGGAVNADLLGNQIPDCFRTPEERKTLVIFTSGGNDVVQLALRKATLAEATPAIDGFVTSLRNALTFLADPANTPGGVRVVFANVYEFTDATGLMSSCPVAAFVGLTGTWADGVAAYAYLEEQYAQAARDFGFDVMFLEENFCGHGYNRNDPSGPCADRAGDLWIGPDCIHPTPAGHAAIADLFWALISR